VPAFALLVSAASLLPAAPRLLAQASAAQVTFVEGPATRERGLARETLQAGASVAQGDAIETGENARLELRFPDGSVLRLGPSARVALTAAHFGQGAVRRQLSVRLFIGKLWAKAAVVWAKWNQARDERPQ
jgi:hypothetical protein